jgi:CBS-domain-containing membrane protein
MMEIPAREIMTRDVITVPATMPVKEIAQVLAERRITGLPVVDDEGRVVGIISELDIISRQGATAADIMSAQVISATEETDAEEVAQLFTSRRIRRVPILADAPLHDDALGLRGLRLLRARLRAPRPLPQLRLRPDRAAARLKAEGRRRDSSVL